MSTTNQRLKISILTPTRRRTRNVERIVKSVLDTSSGRNDIEMIFYVDGDDLETWSIYYPMKDLISSTQHVKIRFVRDKNDAKWYNRWWNFLYKASQGQIVMQGGDDLVFSTPNWDTEVVETFNVFSDRLAVVYCDDGSPDNHLRATHPFLSREWCDLLGYMTPMHFDGAYNDTWITEIGQKTGRIINLDKVLIEHRHPDFNKADRDEVYQMQAQKVNEQNSHEVWKQTQNIRDQDIEKILNLLQK